MGKIDDNIVPEHGESPGARSSADKLFPFCRECGQYGAGHTQWCTQFDSVRPDGRCSDSIVDFDPVRPCDRWQSHELGGKCEVCGLSRHDHRQTAVRRFEADERKAIPVCTGVLDYFPDALREVARLSKIGNDQHNPGEPLHWAKEKSTDHADALVRHLLDRGKRDTDDVRHSAKVVWRALALLQHEIENEK